jgi:Oxidoreductase molybdopterin binding domain
MGKTILHLAALLIASSTLLFAAEQPVAPPIPDQTITVTAQTLAGLPRVTAEAKEHENPAAIYEGVALGSILERAGVPRGEKLRGKGLRAIVVITATDGYEVVFTVAETDPAFNDRLIILADKKDGNPLPEKEGPFRIVIPAEKRPARWIRNVRTIAIKTAN